MATFTRDQILEAATNCTTITALAQRLGCCGNKLSGATAKRLRAIAPELDELLRSNKAKGSSTVCAANVPSNVPDAPDNPYRPRSVYHQIYHEASKGFQSKAAIIEKVAALTAKSSRCIGFSLEVLCRKGHSSNHGSMALRDEDGKRIKLIAVSRNPIH
jgi:hypothetical protein